MATSDRTRELATKWRKEFEAKHRGTTLDEEKLATLLDDALVALLDAFERETRLDEAKWWQRQIESRIQGINFYQYKNFDVANRIERERIAELAAQPTPEVKK